MADSDTGAEPLDQDALVADIDRTRAQLARTIDAISDRVSPKKNVERAMQEVRQGVSRIDQRVSRIDPLIVGAAAAAVVVGVAALLLLRRRKR
jgi:hypothetical protein